MPYFKDTNNRLHFLSSEDVANGGKQYLPTGYVEITDTEVKAILNPPLTPKQISENRIITAKEELKVSDMVAIRCIKANVSFPEDWQTYVTALRDITNGIGTTIPTRPNYPIGT